MRRIRNEPKWLTAGRGTMVALVMLLLGALLLTACGAGLAGERTAAPRATERNISELSPAADNPARQATITPEPTRSSRPSVIPLVLDGLPTVGYNDLPPEARETVARIDQGGPFPFRRDGIVFQNRERILPARPVGYYHEYTVVTPGEEDRGARRIVTGAEGELYYTDDHYASFKRVIR